MNVSTHACMKGLSAAAFALAASGAIAAKALLSGTDPMVIGVRRRRSNERPEGVTSNSRK